MTYRWKDFDKGYNFFLNLTSIKGLHAKLWAPKVARVLVVRILGLPLGSFETKWHLGASPMARHKVYYKREGGAFPKFRPWWVLWVCVCPWFIRAPKCYNYTLTNLLFGLCKFMWVSEVLANLPGPIPELQHVPLPRSAMNQGTHPNSFSFYCFTFGFIVESSRSFEVCHVSSNGLLKLKIMDWLSN